MYSGWRVVVVVCLLAFGSAAQAGWDGVFEASAPPQPPPPDIERPVKEDPDNPLFVPYPKGSRGLTGTAELEFMVRADGSVDAVTIRLLSGTGHKALDEALLAAAPHWRFEPAVSENRPIAAMHRQSMTFAPKSPPPVTVVPPRQDPRHPISLPSYPPGSAELGEQGAVILSFVVRADGSLEPGSVRVTESSGYLALDRAAVDHALAAWRFLPATEKGVAVSAPHQFRVVFDIAQAPR
jgi:protein TonB